VTPLRSLLTLCATALCLAPLLAPRTPEARRDGLLGPFTALAAELEWVRFRSALERGQEARALALAEHALVLAPRTTAGWQMLAAHQGYERGSPSSEPELARRRAWFEAALSTLERGRAHAAEPEELELFRALFLLSRAEQDPELLPGGAAALVAQARAALMRAAELGSPRAAELLRYLDARPAR